MEKIQNEIKYVFIDKKSPLYNEAIDLRYKEFYAKFNRSRESIFDEIEDTSIRIVACIEEKVVGHARLSIEDNRGEVSQVVVNENYRRMKIGAGVMAALIDIATKEEIESLSLDSRISAVDFYEKLGFEVVSEVFVSKKTGVPHVRMERKDKKMNKEYMSAVEASKKYNLFLKVVTSVKNFDSYNSFFNIYEEAEQPCRRIVVLTKNEELEEVYDENPTGKVDECKIIDGNLWIKDYSLLVNPNKIEFSDLIVHKGLIEELI